MGSAVSCAESSTGSQDEQIRDEDTFGDSASVPSHPGRKAAVELLEEGLEGRVSAIKVHPLGYGEAHDRVVTAKGMCVMDKLQEYTI